MDKHISVWSYRLGLACVLLMLVFRGLAAFGIFPIFVPQDGANFGYNAFMRGAVVLLLLSLAAGFADQWRNRKP